MTVGVDDRFEESGCDSTETKGQKGLCLRLESFFFSTDRDRPDTELVPTYLKVSASVAIVRYRVGVSDVNDHFVYATKLTR
jgi:hypothetical protein